MKKRLRLLFAAALFLLAGCRAADSGTTLSPMERYYYESSMSVELIPFFVFFVALLLAALFVVFLLFVKNRRINRNLEKLVEERTKELALQTSTLTTIFDAIPDLVFCKDSSFRFTRCNNSFERYFGWREQDIIGKEDSAGLGMTDEEVENFRAADKMVMQEQRRITIEEYIPAADRAPRFFETIKTPLVQDGKAIGVMGISRDITQRKAVEDTLKLVLDNLNTCIYISNIETGKILFINKKMIEEFGGGNFDGKICWKVFQTGVTERCTFCPIPKLVQNGNDYYIWEEHNTVTGKHYNNTNCLIKWHDGSIVHMQHSVDVTDSKKLLLELEQASKAKSDFLSRMSHEIRTPLNAIIGMIGIAMGAEDRERIKHCLERAANASKHLLGVINDILDMSKIEADKFELDCREFIFEKMLMNISNVTGFRAEEKKQNVIVTLDEHIPACIIGDDLRLTQVVTNLLTNAVKFTPDHGTIRLTVDLTEDRGAEIVLRFTIADNGIGIAKEQQERLFSSFEQADGSISRKFGGTGLGLAISKRFVELMGGSIWIESELGRGSKFIFTVTVGKGKAPLNGRDAGLEAGPGKPEAGTADPALTGAGAFDGHAILIVEDVEINREIMSAVLEDTGLSIDYAEHGQIAVTMFDAHPDKYSLIFMDIHMPVMDGYKATRAIRALEAARAKDIPIIAMTANVFREDIENCLAAGMNDHIGKPVDPETLFAKLEQYMQQKQTHAVKQDAVTIIT